jgi:hypothetical protein
MVENNVWQIIDESQDFPQINKSRKGSNSWSISFQLRIIKQMIHELIIFIYLFIYLFIHELIINIALIAYVSST